MTTKTMAIIASRGTLDGGYPPFILASTAGALGFEVKMFFTFYGLGLLKKDLNPLMSPLGNPAVPMPVPLPVLVQALPGMQALMTRMMRQKIRHKNVASLTELRDMCFEADVKFIACQMTIDLFDWRREELIDNIEVGGAATFLEYAGNSDVNLFI